MILNKIYLNAGNNKPKSPLGDLRASKIALRPNLYTPQQSTDVINFCGKNSLTIKTVLNSANPLATRVSGVKAFDCKNIKELKLLVNDKYTLDYKEILDALLAKINTYDNIQDMVPVIANIFDRRIFASSKRELFNIFLANSPSNNEFLSALEKNSNGNATKLIFKEQIEKLEMYLPYADKKTAARIKKILLNYNRENEKIPKELLGKFQVSRTLSDANMDSQQSITNYMNAHQYIYSNMDRSPDIEDLKKIHCILSNNIPEHSLYKSIIKGTDDDTYQHVVDWKTKKGIAVKATKIEDVPKLMNNFQSWYKNNYNSEDSFLFAAQTYKTLMKIHPFYEINGRTIRLFIEWILGQKGHRIKQYPDHFIMRQNTINDIKKMLIKNSEPINSK